MYNRKRISQVNELMTIHLELLANANLSVLSRQKVIAHLQSLNKELTFLLSFEQTIQTPLPAKVKKRRSFDEVWEKRRLERLAIKKKPFMQLEIDTSCIMGSNKNRQQHEKI